MKQIKTDELDYEGILQNLKTFLQGQSQFDAYDFNGSAMSVLLGILAYNSHLNLLYTNMAINESFIDSASKRASVVSLAKGMGYTAKSARSARATLSVDITLPITETPSYLTLPRGTVFNTVVGDSTYTFSTLTDYTASRLAGIYTFPSIEVAEGTLTYKSFTVATGTLFVIPNLAVDTSTLNVAVATTSSSSTIDKFYPVEDVLRVMATDNVYFMKQRDDMYYEVFFGNDAIGKALNNGNYVKMDYLISSGATANGANAFTYQSGFRPDVGIAVTTIRAAYNGSAEEDIESIRFNAPRMWISQNRALTAADYENILLAKYPNIESIHAWGGQDNVPKVYGKVFITAKPYSGETFSSAEKQNMIDSLLSKRGVVSITPEFVDATFMNIEVGVNLYYNALISRKTAGELETIARNIVIDYGTSLNKFDSVFRYSKLSGLLDKSDLAVTSSVMTIRVRVPATPAYDLTHSYSKSLSNPIASNPAGGNLYTTRFYIPEFSDRCYIKDDGSGTLNLITEDSQGFPTVQYPVGTIDYAGSWTVPALHITSLHDSTFEFVFVPASNDVVSNQSVITTIQTSLISVTAISDEIASGVSTGGANYKFTAVR